MKVPWTGTKCILCTQKRTLSKEHIIPESLGGQLYCKFLCVDCNSERGTELEATAKSDPSILLAAKNLSGEIPVLAKALIESHPHIGHSELGPTPGYIRNSEFHVRSQKLDDGSLIQPTEEARKSVIKKLHKIGFEEVPIQKAIDVFDKTPEDKKNEIVPGLEVVKWGIQHLELDLSKVGIMDPIIPAKMAYEFLACHVGSAICDDFPQLTDIRASIVNKQMNTDAIRIERLSSNKYEPFHGLCFEGNHPHARIQIRLFGWLAFRVHFLRLSIGGTRFAYTHKLDTGHEFVDRVNESK